MAAELDITMTDVDIDALVRDLRAEALLAGNFAVSVREIPFAGPAIAVWGRFLPAGDDRAWADAQFEATEAFGEIVTLETPTGRRDALVYPTNPYTPRCLAAIKETGSPVFELDTTFVEIDIALAPDIPPVQLTFDRALRATAHLNGMTIQDATFIGVEDCYAVADRSGVPVSAFAAAVVFTDRLAQYGTLERHDTTDYLKYRDETFLAACYAYDRQAKIELQAAVARWPELFESHPDEGPRAESLIDESLELPR